MRIILLTLFTLFALAGCGKDLGGNWNADGATWGSVGSEQAPPSTTTCPDGYTQRFTWGQCLCDSSIETVPCIKEDL